PPGSTSGTLRTAPPTPPRERRRTGWISRSRCGRRPRARGSCPQYWPSMSRHCHGAIILAPPMAEPQYSKAHMDVAVDGVKRERLVSPKDRFTSQIRLLVVLILCFAVLPGALLLSVGVLVLVFGHQVQDIVFGILILSLALTLVAGIVATWTYTR